MYTILDQLMMYGSADIQSSVYYLRRADVRCVLIGTLKEHVALLAPQNTHSLMGIVMG